MLYLGVNARFDEHWDRDWPPRGPAFIIPNHNSNFDTTLIEYLFPYRMLGKIRPVAAKDYWAKWKLLDLFARYVARVIYVERGSGKSGVDPYVLVHEAIARGEIIVIYPEGTRGNPEQMAEIKKGISHLMQKHPDVPFIPVHIYGAGKAQGQVDRWWKVIPLPFIVDVHVEAPIIPRTVLEEAALTTPKEGQVRLHEHLEKRMHEMHDLYNRGSWE